jgi:plasmid stabilization system protein ParE
MEKYNVLIADKALRDMENIYQYIAEELLSPETAMRQYNRIADSILSLEGKRRGELIIPETNYRGQHNAWSNRR